MKRFLKRNNLLFFAFFLLSASCGSVYKHKQEIGKVTPEHSVLQYTPVLEKELYRCVVDGGYLFKKYHLSGLLLFKKMEDQSTRIVFQNEMGFTFFDFEFLPDGSYKVWQIIPQLNRKAVIMLLVKDLNFLLLRNLDAASETLFVNRKLQENWHGFTLDKGKVFYKIGSAGITGVENTGKRARVITIDFKGEPLNKTFPQHILFTHHKANFTIQLAKIVKQDDTETAE